MRVQMDTGLVPLDVRLEEYGFKPETSRLINCLADKGVMSVEDVWYVTGEYWKLVKEADDER